MRYRRASVGEGGGGGREGDWGGNKNGSEGRGGYDGGLRNARPLLGKIRSDFFVHPVALKQ